MAKVFEVSLVLVAQWENGTDPDPDGKIRGTPLPEALAPLLTRWVETGDVRPGKIR